MLTASLLDDGGHGLARVLAGICVGLVLLLFMAVFVPVVVVGMLVGSIDVQTLTTMLPAAAVRGIGSPVAASPRAETGSRAAEIARRYLGVRYAFGGSDPGVGFDCSGLVQRVFQELGVRLPRTAQAQYDATGRLTREELRPGDLVFFARTYADSQSWITHVGIYIGDGQQISAPTEGQVVSIQPVFSGFWGAHFVAGGRVGSG